MAGQWMHGSYLGLLPLMLLACSSNDGSGGSDGAGSGGAGSGGATVADGLLSAPIENCTLDGCQEVLSGTLDGTAISVMGTGAFASRWEIADGWMAEYEYANGGFILLQGTGNLTSAGPQTITSGVMRLANDQPLAGTWYCIGAGTVTDLDTLSLTNLSRLGSRADSPETTDWLSLIMTQLLSEPTRLEGTLDGAAFTAASQWGGGGFQITTQGFLGSDSRSGFFWSWLSMEMTTIQGVYEGAAVFTDTTGWSVRIGGTATTGYTETVPQGEVNGYRYHVELKDLIGPLTCPGTAVTGSLTGGVS